MRIACDTAGVGVKASSASASTCTSLAWNTSIAVTHAGSDSACVSRPMNSGPSMPCCARYSQIAWLVAAMWSSLNVVRSDEPRWPEVPNETRWPGSSGSGWRSS